MKTYKIGIGILMILVFLNCTDHSNSVHNIQFTDSKELGLQLMSVWESGDTSKLIEFFHQDGQYVDIPNHHIFEGIKGAKDYISHVHSWGSNINMEIRSSSFSESGGVLEWTFTAIQSSPIKGRVPIATNNEIKINGVTIIDIKEGKIIKATDYLDALGFVIQLGSKIELPGGVVIGGE